MKEREIIEIYKDEWDHLYNLFSSSVSDEENLYSLLATFINNEKLEDRWISLLKKMIKLEQEDKLDGVLSYGNLQKHLENWTTPE